MRMDARHRMLRATDGIDTLRRHFKLGVNFIETLVNRHRIEAYILDTESQIAASFERIHWDEQEVVNRTIEVFQEKNEDTTPAVSLKRTARPIGRKKVLPMIGTLASLAVAFFPKCPVCWAAYLSVFGIASLNQIPYSPWLQAVLVAVILINLVSVFLRGRLTGRMSGFYLVSAGALAIVVSKMGLGWENAAVWGVALTLVGSLLSALSAKKGESLLNELIGQMWRKQTSKTSLGWNFPQSLRSKARRRNSVSKGSLPQNRRNDKVMIRISRNQ